MRRSKLFLLFMLAMVIALMAGCAKGEDAQSAKNEAPKDNQQTPAKPITLKLFYWSQLNDEMQQKLVVEPVKKKFPNITLEFSNRDGGSSTDNAVLLSTGGNEVDIMAIQSGPILGVFKTYKLLEDLTPLIKKNNANLDRFQPEYLDAIRAESGNNTLLGLPFATNLWGVIYNKDIFDKFGVAYPKDGMTWDDAYELAKKVTRNDNGTQYKGLDIYTLHSMAQPLSLVTVDAATDRASLDWPGWARVIALAKKINDIPGNALPIVTAAKTKDRFYKDKVVAMLAYDSITAFLTDDAMKKSGMNWDMVEYPSYPERPNTHGIVKVSPMYSIASYSKHKDEAMQVIDLLTSDEVQVNFARLGGVPVTKNPEAQKQFGAEIPGAQSKNLAGIFKSKPAPFAMQTEYSDRAQGLLSKKFDEIMKGKDYNTAIRELEEQINSEIDTEKTK